MSVTALRRAWRKFVCRACGLIYDEAVGDPDSGIAPGTRFEDIPDSWSCPLCGVTKADFEPFDDAPPRPRDPRRRSPQPKAQASSRHAPPVVIVGAGHAGWAMAKALRERDGEAPITLVTACSGDVYDKPLLSVALARKIGETAFVRESGVAAAERLNVRLLANTVAVRIDRATSTLRTTRGPLRYRDLVLAHGASPRDVGELPATLCWRINHLDAYRRFRAALGPAAANPPPTVAVCGAGLVGCELANDLASAGYSVTLLDVAARPLASLLDEASSQRLVDAWRGLPLRFVGNVQIDGVALDGIAGGPLGGIERGRSGTAGQRRISTRSGATFEADHVVAATGLVTPTRLAASAGLAWDGGIRVDPESLRTSVPNVFALGDCISIDGLAHRYIEPIGRQARHIASTLTGAEATPYASARPPIRIKTGSLPMTVR